MTPVNRAMASSSDPGLYELGIVVKAHGTHGGFLMQAVMPVLPIQNQDVVYLRYPEHQWVPYRIDEIRLHNDGKRKLFFVRLEGIQSRNDAELLRDHQVKSDRMPESVDNETDLDVTGYQVIREDLSHIGTVNDVIETPAYEILVVQTGEKDILIPLVDAYVTKIDEQNNRIVVQNTSDLEAL